MEEAAPLSCPRCSAANSAGASFCTQCGAPLRETPETEAAPSGRARTRRSAARGDAAEQARARHEFSRIKNIVLTVRAVFWAEALYAFVLALLWHLILSQVDPDERSGYATLVTVLVWAQCALMTVGAVAVLRAPLVWTTVGACASTLYVSLAIYTLDFEVPPALLFKAFLAVAFWFAVAQAARVQKLMAADPSLQIVRKRIDPSRRVQGGVADAARERRREERRSALFGRLKVAGLVGVLIVVAVFVVRELTKPPTVDDAVAGFRSRWTGGDVAAVSAQFADGADGRKAASLREELERRGWLSRLPALGEQKIEAREEWAKATWPVDGGEVTASYQLLEPGWFLVDVTLPPIHAPDLTAGLDEFRAAWTAKGTDALLAMVRESSRDRFGRSIVRVLERREWHEQRPGLGEVDAGTPKAGRATVLFAMGNDELEVRFEYWHPKWRLDGLRLPKE